MRIINLTYNDYLQILKSRNREYKIKVELLYPNMEIFEEITSDISSSSGSLHIEFVNGVRRNVSLTINDPKRKYFISPNKLWLNTYFRVYKGFYYKDSYIWFLQGTFVLKDPTVISDFTSRTIDLIGVDKMALLDGTLGGSLDATYQIPTESFLKNALQAILTDAGDTSPLIYDSIFNDYQIPYTITRDDTYFAILEELAYLRSSNVFYDIYGNLNFVSGIEDLDDTFKPSLYSFRKDGIDINYIRGNVNYGFSGVKNHIFVIGATVDGEIFDAMAIDTNPESPVSVGTIGHKKLVIRDDNINTTQYAQDRANFELKKRRVLYMSANLTTMSLPHLDVNCVIDVTDVDLNFDQQRLLIQSIDDSYGIDQTMSIVCSNVNEISFVV